ncbi:hypothetical protein [Thermococcus sp.]
MDSAIFMERYGYRILLGVAILVLLGVIAAASTTIYNLFKEFGGYMALILLIGIILYVLFSRGKTKENRGEVERKAYEKGLKRY